MDMIDQREKTLVFCATQDHALAVRDLINQMKESQEPNYCVRVTANDGALGEQHLRTFQDNEKTIPTILTTSQKLSTGVDARNIRNIVLMRPVNSMIEFKQIIGRGTRLFEGKDYFTIYDFVKAYHHFEDSEWDGEPLEPPEPSGERAGDGDNGGDTGDGTDGGSEPPEPPKRKIKIKLADGKERTIQHISATSFWGVDGKPISAAEFLQRMFGDLPEFFKDEDELRAIWSQPDTRKKLLENLSEKGYGTEVLGEIKRMIDAEKSDVFDVLAYIAFALSPITREERVSENKERIFSRYNYKQQAFLHFVLSHYINEGVGELDQEKLPDLLELKYGTISDVPTELGSVAGVRELFVGFQQYLYQDQ